MRIAIRASVLVIFLGFMPILSWAQSTSDVAQGLTPYQSFMGGDIDSIGLSSGSLVIQIPIVSYPERGGKLRLNFELVVNSKYMVAQEDCAPGGGGCVLQWGGVPVFQQVVDDQNPRYVADVYSPAHNEFWYEFAVITADNAQHPLGPNSTTTEASLDATGWVAIGASTTTLPTYLIDRNGIRYPQSTTQGSSGVIREDANGNQILLNPTTNVYKDTVGRSIPKNPATSTTTGCVGPLQTSSATVWTLPSLNGGTMQIKFCYATLPLDIPTLPEFGGLNGSEPVLQQIILQNGTSWMIEYNDRNPGDPTSVNYGEVTKITLPTGGTISYTYATVLGSLDSYSRWVTSRTTNANDGTGAHSWNYSYGGANLTTQFSGTTTVTDPLGNATVHSFTNLANTNNPVPSYFETGTQHYQGSSSAGTLLKTVSTVLNYYVDETCCNLSWPGPSDIYPKSVTTTWPNHQVAQIQTDYDANMTVNSTAYTYGNIIKKREYDYGTSAPGTLVRTTVTDYKAFDTPIYLTNNLLALPSSVQITDSGGVQRSYTTYAYDESSLGSSGTGLSQQHDTTPLDGANRGNQTSVHRWLSTTGGYLTSTATYFDTGELQIAYDPKLNPTTYSYSATYLGAYPTSVKNALNQSTSSTYDLNTGLPTSTTDPNSQTTSYTYDATLRPTSFTYPLQVVNGTSMHGLTTVCYSDEGSSSGGLPGCTQTAPPYKVGVTDKMNSFQNITTSRVFDGLGRVSQVQGNSDPIGIAYTNTVFDAVGRLQSATNPYRQTSDPTYGLTSNTYDALGRVTRVTKPDNSTVTTSYAGGCVTVLDDASNSLESCTDGLGRLTKVLEPDSSGFLRYETDYQYDVLNNLVGVTQKGGSFLSAPWRIRTFVYDSLSRLTSATNPESGTVTYVYDNNGNIYTRTDARNIITTYRVDSLNRVTNKSYSDGTLSAHFLYDVAASWGGPFTNVIGRMTYAYLTDPGLTVGSVFGYDSMGRITMNNECAPSTCPPTTGFVQDYTYDLAGNMTSSMASAADITFSYTYDTAARITQLTSNFVSTNHPPLLATFNSYFPEGQVQQSTFGDGLTESNMLNPRLQHCRYNLNSSATILQTCSDPVPSVGNIQDLTYGFGFGAGDNGNVLATVGVGAQAFNRTYSYDQLNRLTAMTGPGGSCTGMSFTYDGWGNRLTESPTAGTCNNSALSYSANNQISTTGFTYDASGNLTHDANHGYFYDAENRLTQVDGTAGSCGTATACYSYDALGRRVERTTAGVTTDYLHDLSSNPVAEFSSLCSMCRTVAYAYVKGVLVAEYADNSTFFIHQDQLGSSRILTTLTGGVADCNAFYPFGEQDPSICASSTTTTHKFEGKERDAESNLDNFGARYLGSSIGRFMSPDSLGAAQNPRNPQSWNLYGYVLNNPLRFLDPSGQFTCDQKTVTDRQCDEFATALDTAQTAADNIGQTQGWDSEAYLTAQRAIDAYGDEGVDNGVTIAQGDVGAGLAQVQVAGNTVAKTTDNPNGQNIRVTFDKGSNVLGVDPRSLAALAGHEGVHVADGSDWVSSGFSDNANPSRFQSEFEGYRVEGNILVGLGANFMQLAWGNGTRRYSFFLPIPPDSQRLTKMIDREYPNVNLDMFSRNTKLPGSPK